MALNEKRDDMRENASEKTSNVRQLPSSHQNQILSALDTLGAKLVRSESERETMKRLLNEALDAQERLENQLERSHIDIQRRMDKLDSGTTGGGLTDEDRHMIEEQSRAIEDSKTTLDDYNIRQVRMEDKLRDSQQTIAKLQRRIDSQEQKRAKLQRRIERVENMAADAQNALEAKALVLLTDQSHAYHALPHVDATAPIEALNALHNDTVDIKHVNADKSSWGDASSLSWLAIVVALGLGWGIATFSQKNDKALLLMQDGRITQVNLDDGSAREVTLDAIADVRSLNIETPTIETPRTIEEELALFASEDPTDWITDEILENAMDDQPFDATTDETVPVTGPLQAPVPVAPTEITIDRDLTLPAAIKPIEDKAFMGIPEAQHDLAALYTAGQANVHQNYERAAYWFRQAAAQDIANAAYNLGVLYHQGLGIGQDMDRALDWYRRAAQLGHPEAQYNLGIAYIEGVGTRYNPNMAAAFFQQAAFGGIVEAAYNLGLILENGLLGEVRNDDALKWYRGAAEKGSLEAEQAFKALATRLNLDENGAGLMQNGETLAIYIDKNIHLSDAQADEIGLGDILPTREQILIAQVQEQLRKMKYYNGPQDGIVGAGTVQAVKSYQTREGLEVTGQATPELLSYMLSNEKLYN